MSDNITLKQRRVLKAIYESIENEGFPPTLADLREEIKVSSNQSVLNFLETLEKKGFIKREEGQARSIKILPLGFKILGKRKLVPHAGTSAAGSYIESFADTFQKWVELPSIALEKVKESQDDVFVIRVYGDSMINAGIDDGDVLLIKKTREYKNGDIVVARYEDGTTVKRFVAENKKTYLKPENPNYPVIPIYPETFFEGRVILNLSKIKK